MRKSIQQNCYDFAGITLGSLIYAISYAWFLIPFKVAPGGIGGLAQVLFHIFHIPAGVSMIIFNVPLFIMGWILMGKRFGIRSFYGMFIGSVLVDVVSPHWLYEHVPVFQDFINTEYWAFTDNIFLASVAGSVLLGFGLGIIFRFRGSTGGTDIPVAIIKQYTGISIGTGYWIIETAIIFSIGLVFKDLNLIIWGYLNLFITTKIVDITAEGLPYVKGAYIISPRYEAIKREIFQELNRGVTLFHGEGGYSGKAQKIIFCAVNRRQIAQLRRLVKEIDPHAFMLLSDIYDVMGYGFKARSLDFVETPQESNAENPPNLNESR